MFLIMIYSNVFVCLQSHIELIQLGSFFPKGKKQKIASELLCEGKCMLICLSYIGTGTDWQYKI